MLLEQLPGADVGLVVREQQQVAVGDGVRRIKHRRGAERRNGLRHPPQVLEHQPETVVRSGRIGHEADGRLQLHNDFVVVPFGTQRIPEVVVGTAVIGIQFDAPAHHFDDEVRAPGQEPDLGQWIEHIPVFRESFHESPQEPLGSAQVPGLQKLHGPLINLPGVTGHGENLSSADSGRPRIAEFRP